MIDLASPFFSSLLLRLFHIFPSSFDSSLILLFFMIQTIFCAQLHLIPTCTSHPTLQTYSAGCITTEWNKWIRTVIRKRCEKMGWWAKVRKGTIGSFLKLGGDNCKHLQSLCLVILICFILCCKCGPFYLPFPLFSVFFLFARKSSQRKEEKQPRFTCARLRKTKPSESICILPSHPWWYKLVRTCRRPDLSLI